MNSYGISGRVNVVRRLFWRVRLVVSPNEVGFLYGRDMRPERLGPGVYERFDFGRYLTLVTLPLTSRFQHVINQEVLTQDNIALRFSYFVEYVVQDPEKLIAKLDIFRNDFAPLAEAETLIHNLSQVFFRRVISEIEAEDLNARRNDIVPEVPDELAKDLGEYGISIVRLTVRDITFPKSIQDVLAKSLEAKIRSKTDLENARTQVAAARALKNAASMMDESENIKFIQYLEMITKIADKGKHTFLIGDFPQKSVDFTNKR